jgi:hypothetical protein
MGHISEPPFSEFLKGAAAGVLAQAESRLAPWGLGIRLGPVGRANVYDCFPYLFREVFPAITDERLLSLAVASRLLASALLANDSLIDGDVESKRVPAVVATAVALQAEAYRGLHKLFPPDSPFWNNFDIVVRNFNASCLEEKSYLIGGELWSKYSEEIAVRLALGKNRVPHLVIAGLSELSSSYVLHDVLCSSLDRYYIARQFYDDLMDWEKDLRSRSATLLLKRLSTENESFGRCLRDGDVNDDVKREIFYGGHALRLMEEAIDSASRAEQAIADLPAMGWNLAIRHVRGYCESMHRDISEVVARNQRRVKRQPEMSVRLIASSDVWLTLGRKAIDSLLLQWQRGFGEFRQAGSLPHEWSPSNAFFTNASGHGDLFQRALVIDCLLDANDVHQGGLEPLLRHEIDELTAQVLRDWTYSRQRLDRTHLVMLADMSANLIRAQHRTGAVTTTVPETDNPLLPILRALFADVEGCKEPASGREKPGSEDSHRFLPATLLDDAADVGVVANIGHAIWFALSDRFPGVVARARAIVLGRQGSDGAWRSDWFPGPQYPSLLAVRFLSAVGGNSVACSRLVDFLMATQRPDGGWAAAECDESDALSTALSVSCLAALYNMTASNDEAKARALLDAAGYARSFLAESGDGESRETFSCFFRIDGAGSHPIGRSFVYGRKTLTAAFVMRAAVSWSDVTRSQT